MNQGRRFLFVMWEGGGTVPPTLGLARRVIERGHRVSVLGDPTIEQQALAAGCHFTSWRRAPHRTTLRPEEDLLKDWETSNPLQMLARARDRFIAGPAARYAADTLDAIAEQRPEAMICDYTLFGAHIAAEKAKVPTGALVPNIWPIPLPGIPSFGPGFALAKTSLGRFRDAVVTRLVTRLFERGLPALNAARKDLGLAPLRTFFDQVLRSDRVFVLASAAFDFSSRFVPNHVRYLGPILDEPQWALPWSMPWPAGNRDPIVLVAFSSTFQNQGPVLRRIVAALAELPVRAIVTLGDVLDQDEVKSKGAAAVVRSAPHRVILENASLMITHCGHGSTMKALAAGVPLLCMPMGRDQNDTAARVVHKRAGLRLSPRASVASIRRTVRRLLDDNQYRRNAQRFSETLDREHRSVDPVGEIESLLAQRAVEPFRYQS
jgi:MGT family glycosyltransferase